MHFSCNIRHKMKEIKWSDPTWQEDGPVYNQGESGREEGHDVLLQRGHHTIGQEARREICENSLGSGCIYSL